MNAKFSPIRHYPIDPARLYRWNATYRAYEPLGAAILVVLLFGLAVEYVPGLAQLLGAFADAAMATKP